MSFLVLVIMDREQKEMVNRMRLKHPSRSDEYELVHYYEDGEKAPASDRLRNAKNSLELPENMPIVEAYFRYVERYIYSHKKARTMLSLDGDPVRIVMQKDFPRTTIIE